MVVSGLPIRNGDKHAGEICTVAMDLMSAIGTFKIRHQPNNQMKLRVGIHTGLLSIQSEVVHTEVLTNISVT